MREGPVQLVVCDDDVTVRMQFGMALDDVVVHEATRGHETVALAREVGADAVCMDVRLPDMDGLEAVRALRAEPTTAACVILVLTAGHDPAKRPDVLAAGADEYLAKPFDPVEVRTLLERLLAVPAEERKVRRTLHRARIQAGMDDGGVDDLPEVPGASDPEPAASTKRRWRRDRA